MAHTRSIERSVFEHGHDIAASVIQWVRQADIDQVLVGGRIMVRGGRYVFRDREELERKAYESQRQWMLTPANKMISARIRERYAPQDIGGQPYYHLNSTMNRTPPTGAHGNETD